MPVEVTTGTLIADLLEAWRINDCIDSYLIDHVPEDAWAAKPPGGKGRSIAAILAHIHNVRVMWVKAAAKGSPLPDKADAAGRDEVKGALAESGAAITRILENGLAVGKVSGFAPSAAAFLAYMLAHEAHHRGQVVLLARQLGHPVPAKASYGLWEWNSRGRGAE